MLQRQPFHELHPDEDTGQTRTPWYFYEILKRRAFYFVIPFLLILAAGSLSALMWPAKYLSQGTILVSSQQIPTDLVRPTVATMANERIQVIEQRIMTRDNLLALAKKYNLITGLQERLSGTEIVDFIKARFQLKPVEQKLQTQRTNAISFTVGFEYEQPEIAMKVANEFVTMILDADVKTRTGFASETSRFLAEDVKTLEAQLTAIGTQISEMKRRRLDASADSGQLDDGKDIAALKAQLLIKSAIYSDTHPEIRALKRKIAALEKGTIATDESKSKKPNDSAKSNTVGLDTLLTQELSLKAQLTSATEKLARARLGENLERGQISERLEVIDQPRLPGNPISPNRPRIFILAFILALMAGSGLVFAAESLNPAIRRSSDLYSIIDSQLIVSIPYISTQGELQRQKSIKILALGIFVVAVLAGLVTIFLFLPPIDILFDKMMMKLR